MAYLVLRNSLILEDSLIRRLTKVSDVEQLVFLVNLHINE